MDLFILNGTNGWTPALAPKSSRARNASTFPIPAPCSQITGDFATVVSKLSCPKRRPMLPDWKRCKQRRTLLAFGLGTPILVLFVGSLCSIASADSAAHTPTQVSLTWRNILTLAATTGFLTARLNQGVSF